MRLTEAREKNGLKKTQLDELAGLPMGTTHDIESGRNKRPAWEVVCKLAKTLGADPNWLFPVETKTA